MFENARRKVAQAKVHTEAFNSKWNDYVETKPIIIKSDGRYGQTSYAAMLTQPAPQEIMLLAGDAIHNLRSALDHMIWEVTANHRARLSAAVIKRIQFPVIKGTASKAKAVISALNWATVSQKALLDHLEVFEKGSGAAIVGLHELDVQDKHTSILPFELTLSFVNLRVQSSGASVFFPAPQVSSSNFTMLFSPTRNVAVSGGTYYGIANVASFRNTPYQTALLYDDIELLARFGRFNISQNQTVSASLDEFTLNVERIIKETESFASSIFDA